MLFLFTELFIVLIKIIFRKSLAINLGEKRRICKGLPKPKSHNVCSISNLYHNRAKFFSYSAYWRVKLKAKDCGGEGNVIKGLLPWTGEKEGNGMSLYVWRLSWVITIKTAHTLFEGFLKKLRDSLIYWVKKNKKVNITKVCLVHVQRKLVSCF